MTRRLVAVLAAFNVLTGALYFVFGFAAMSVALHQTEVAGGAVSTDHLGPGLRAALFTGYAIFLFASGVGLWREQPWGWILGMIAGGFSIVLAMAALLNRSWGAAAFDAAYGALLLTCLLRLRRPKS